MGLGVVGECLPHLLREDPSPDGSKAPESGAWCGMVEWRGTYGGSIWAGGKGNEGERRYAVHSGPSGGYPPWGAGDEKECLGLERWG